MGEFANQLRGGAAALSVTLALAAPVGAAELGPLEKITGADPFAACTADNASGQAGVNYPGTGIEPWITVDPHNPRRLVAGWQQDRWSNGGSRGLTAGVRREERGGWKVVAPGKVTQCQGGPYARASDPWADFSPSGVLYYMHLAFQPDTPTGGFGANGMLMTRSFDGGASWTAPIALIADTDPQVLNDKNSMTADPRYGALAYAVWDRLQDFTITGSHHEHGGAAPTMGPGDGVAAARARARALKTKAKAAATVEFIGPAYFTRTIDYGSSWETPRIIFDPGPNAQTIDNLVVTPPNGAVLDFFTHIYTDGSIETNLVRSFDHGRTFGPAIVAETNQALGVVTPDTQAPVRDASILYSVTVDRRTGALYMAWQDARFHGYDEIAFARSTDNGATWSPPVRINKTPGNANPLRSQAFIPAIEVGPHGVLVVTYYDFRKDVDDGKEATDYWAIFCEARERDCTLPVNWGRELRLTNASFDLSQAPVAGGLFLGDYMGLKRAADSVYPAFTTTTGPQRTDVFTRQIRFEGDRMAED